VHARLSICSGAYAARGAAIVVLGNSGADQQRQGTLELLSADLGTVLLTVSFRGLGLVSLAEQLPTAVDQVATARAEMYCEEMTLTGPR
jgi:hypothetical protein